MFIWARVSLLHFIFEALRLILLFDRYVQGLGKWPAVKCFTTGRICFMPVQENLHQLTNLWFRSNFPERPNHISNWRIFFFFNLLAVIHCELIIRLLCFGCPFEVQWLFFSARQGWAVPLFVASVWFVFCLILTQHLRVAEEPEAGCACSQVWHF